MVIEVTVVIPCLNEAETLRNCIIKAKKAFADYFINGEIVVADNGSNDGSQQIAVQNGARLISIKERGYGSALKGGIEAATGKYIIMGDADDSYDFSKIHPFIEKLREGYDFVMGCRLARGGGTILPGAMPWKNKYIGNPILSFLGRLFFGSQISDFHCGLRAFTKDAYLKMSLKTTGMEFATEMVVKAHLYNLKVTSIPIVLHPDGRTRPPHLRPWKDGWRHLRFMLLWSPNYLFMLPGGLLLLIGLMLLVGVTFQLINVGYPFGLLEIHSMILGCILALLGFGIVTLGLFAKVFSVEHLGIGGSKIVDFFLRHYTLERGVVFGIIIFMLGFAGNLYVVYQWYLNNFNIVDEMLTKLTLWGLTLMVIGAQIILSSFFISIPRTITEDRCK